GLRKSGMGLLDTLLGGGGKRTYTDLAPGSYPAEAAEYAEAKEVKAVNKDGLSIAMFGGGCFWGLELAYQRVPGVVGTACGYAQGQVVDPSYEAVCSGTTGHTEVISMTYNPKEVSYQDLCKVLFSRINPSLKNQVGKDPGTQAYPPPQGYRHGIYTTSPEQMAAAQEVVTEVRSPPCGTPHHVKAKSLATHLTDPYPPREQYLEKGGRGGNGQNAAKGATETIRCYG
ncbi:putative methionine sulfoxide reductase, partial [Baffinella frigidus]